MAYRSDDRRSARCVCAMSDINAQSSLFKLSTRLLPWHNEQGVWRGWVQDSLSLALPYVWSIKISVNRTQSKTKHTNCKSCKCVKFFRHVLKLPSIMQSERVSSQRSGAGTGQGGWNTCPVLGGGGGLGWFSDSSVSVTLGRSFDFWLSRQQQHSELIADLMAW